jgi:hypothetical protein
MLRVGCQFRVMGLACGDAIGQARWCGRSYGGVYDRSACSGRAGVGAEAGCGRGADRGTSVSVGGAAPLGITPSVPAGGSDPAGCAGDAAAAAAVVGLPGPAFDVAALALRVDRAVVGLSEDWW